MTTRPIEPPGGQDGPPDVRTALHATIRLLEDVRDRLGRNDEDHDLYLRVVAVRSALRRLRRSLDDRP